MTRDRKLNKLANAIRTYVGGYVPATGEWKYFPKPSAWEGVVRWMKALKIDTTENLMRVKQGFKTDVEFQSWMKKL